ncbi:MAG: DUF5698 domain-containing protein [Oscillospiraceae bacterium]|nr:DUF5698 domain-containing protein [Oscillospiraceae bacterium]
MMDGIFLYFLIFMAKLTEVSVATVRVVLTAKGNRIAATLLSVAEISIWIIVASKVLLGLDEDPLMAVAYGAAFVVGIYLGILIEDKLALGLSEIECIAGQKEAEKAADQLRALGFGVTEYECEGMEGKKKTLDIKVQRKDVPKAMAILKKYDNLFVTVRDISKLSMGSIGRRFIAK